MIIDAHNHPLWYGYTVERFLENMDTHKIDRTWLLSWESPRHEYNPAYNHIVPDHGENGPIVFDHCLEFAQKAPDRFILGYAPDPRKPDAIDRLAAMKAIHGVRVCGEVKLRMMYDDWDALRLFRFCGAEKMPVTVHLDYEFDTGQKYPRPNWWYGGGIEPFERAIRACPETIFLGHAPGFWAHISGDDRYDKEAYPTGTVVRGGRIPVMLRAYPNLYCDLSAGSGLNALSRDPGFAREFIDEFQDRLLYARDCFDNRLEEFLKGLHLPAGILEKIFSGNALKLVPF